MQVSALRKKRLKSHSHEAWQPRSTSTSGVGSGASQSSFGLESLDTWFRTLYLVYGLGLGTPKLISCRVELRRALRLLDMCFGKGLVAS